MSLEGSDERTDTDWQVNRRLFQQHSTSYKIKSLYWCVRQNTAPLCVRSSLSSCLLPVPCRNVSDPASLSYLSTCYCSPLGRSTIRPNTHRCIALLCEPLPLSPPAADAQPHPPCHSLFQWFLNHNAQYNLLTLKGYLQLKGTLHPKMPAFSLI